MNLVLEKVGRGGEIVTERSLSRRRVDYLLGISQKTLTCP